jgi:threonine synthase
MFNCPHTGVALAVLRKLVERKVIRSNQRVVVISTAHGLKFHEQKTAYHLGLIPGLPPAHANRPLEIRPDAGLVQDAIRRHADKMRIMEA